jgi:nucleoside-diphosphate-sugar epimerase
MVLVTGGTGFIGSYIIKELVQKGYAVRALRRSTSKLPFFISAEIFDKIEWVDGDVLDVVSLENAMQSADEIIHAAAIVSFYKKDKKKMMQVNVEGTANVVNMALEKNISRFVHVSSVAALGRTITGDIVNEEKKWQLNKLNTNYATSKYKAEMEVWRGIGEGLNAVIINPSTVLGFGDWNTTSCRIFKTIYDEFPWYTTGINGFVDIEDVARATVLSMESNISEERFIVNGDNWSFQKLFNAIADCFKKRHPYKEATPFLAGLAWRMERIKSFFKGDKPMLTKENARVAQSKTYFDNNKILKALPQFSFTPLQNTIEKACKKYLDAIK